MTRVDFYVIPEGDDGPLPTACRLCDRAVAAGHRVHVHVPDSEQAQAMDRMLWTWKQGSFVAHERVDAVSDSPPIAKVLLGDGEPRPDHQDVLLNFADSVPPFFSRFGRVLEIVHGDEDARTKSRARFKYYRDRGYPLETHKL